MILILHISSAFLSVICAFFALLIPDKFKLKLTYTFTSTTVVSGILLAIANKISFGEFCISGLLYLTFLTLLIIAAKKKLLEALI